MAVYTITPANVTPKSVWVRSVAAVQVNAGQAITVVNQQLVLADANNGAISPMGACHGIAVATSAPGQPAFYVPTGGRVALDPVGVGNANSPVFLANTAGGLQPHSDLSGGGTMAATFVGLLNTLGRELLVNIAVPEGSLV